MTDIAAAKEGLSHGATLALVKGGAVYTSCVRGVRPLLEILDTGADYSDFSAADKVVGRGAAFIYLALGVKRVYAAVISESALCLLREGGVGVEYGEVAPRILNREGDGPCPIENAVIDIKDTESAIFAIRKRLSELQ